MRITAFVGKEDVGPLPYFLRENAKDGCDVTIITSVDTMDEFDCQIPYDYKVTVLQGFNLTEADYETITSHVLSSDIIYIGSKMIHATQDVRYFLAVAHAHVIPVYDTRLSALGLDIDEDLLYIVDSKKSVRLFDSFEITRLRDRELFMEFLYHNDYLIKVDVPEGSRIKDGYLGYGFIRCACGKTYDVHQKLDIATIAPFLQTLIRR